MRSNILKELFYEDKLAINGWLSSDSRYIAEILGHCGYDAVAVDLQHGQFGIDAVPGLLQAISSTPAMPWVRSSGNDMSEINKLLDMGAYGLICPMIETVEQAHQLVNATRYPPLGFRSYGPGRGFLYAGDDYLEYANEKIIVLAMIETQKGLENAEQIIETPGLDGIYIGPNDLALSFGIPLEDAVDDSILKGNIKKLVNLCKKHKKHCGIFCNNIEISKTMYAEGVSLITPGNDVSLLRSQATHCIRNLRDSEI